MATEQQIEQLYEQFVETEEMVEWDDFKAMTAEALEQNPDAETVTVPAAFLRRVMDEIATQPLIFSALLERHNRLCDRLGMPEEKCTIGGFRLRSFENMALDHDMTIPRNFPLKFVKRKKRNKP